MVHEKGRLDPTSCCPCDPVTLCHRRRPAVTTISGDRSQSERGGIRHQSQPGHRPLPVAEHPLATVLLPDQLGGYLCLGLLPDFFKLVYKACQLSRQRTAESCLPSTNHCLPGAGLSRVLALPDLTLRKGFHRRTISTAWQTGTQSFWAVRRAERLDPRRPAVASGAAEAALCPHRGQMSESELGGKIAPPSCLFPPDAVGCGLGVPPGH